MMENNHLSIKTYMAIKAERDTALRERNMALEERKRAFAERDMAMIQRDAAIAECNAAIQERDDAIAVVQLRETSMNNLFTDLQGSGVDDEVKDIHYQQQMRNVMVDDQVKHCHYHQQTRNAMVDVFSPREALANDIPNITEVPPEVAKPVKQLKEYKVTKSPKSPRKRKPDGLSKQENSTTLDGWKNGQNMENNEKLDRQLGTWKHNLGLNQINFDESTMPVPVCSCTGTPQPCYKSGNGGWQSACCTTTISMYPLPQVSNKRYTRVGGRKMSGGAFSKLLNRLATEGCDLYCAPVDLKDHWAKHGTNRYSTLK